MGNHNDLSYGRMMTEDRLDLTWDNLLAGNINNAGLTTSDIKSTFIVKPPQVIHPKPAIHRYQRSTVIRLAGLPDTGALNGDFSLHP